MLLPLWAIGTGAASLAGGLAYGLSQGKRNTISNPNNLPNLSEPKKMNPIDFLNSFLDTVNYGVKGAQEEWREVYDNNFGINRYNDLNPYERALKEMSTSGFGGQEPAWLKNVARARSTSDYQNWLKQSQGFELGGQKYKWVEADSPEGQRVDIVRNSSDEIADKMSRLYTTNPEQYKGSYLNLLNEKQRLTGKRYIPVRLPVRYS